MTTDILASSRRKKRKKFLWKAGLTLLSIFLFLGGVTGFFYVSKFRINDISVEGANVLDEEQIREEIVKLLKRKFLKIIPRDNIFILSKSEIAAKLIETFPALKSIAIGRDFPQKISFFLEERKPEALWCLGQVSTNTISDLIPRSLGEAGCAFVDENGFIFQPAPIFSGAIFPVFYDERQPSASPSGELSIGIGKEMIAKSEFQKLLSFNKILGKNNMEVAKIILKDGWQYEIYLKESWYILLNDKNESNLSFSNLQLVLDGTIKEKRPTLEYVDLRSGNKVFYKYK
jgi:hypothetical protein